MEILLVYDPHLVKEVWLRMQGWYNMAYKYPPPPARITLARITKEQVEIYRRVPPPGYRITIEMVPFAIDDSILSMEKIKWEVPCLRRHRLGGGVRHVSGTLAVFSEGGYSRGTAAHGQVGAGSRDSSDGVQGRQATNGVHVSDVGPHP